MQSPWAIELRDNAIVLFKWRFCQIHPVMCDTTNPVVWMVHIYHTKRTYYIIVLDYERPNGEKIPESINGVNLAQNPRINDHLISVLPNVPVASQLGTEKMTTNLHMVFWYSFS